MSEFTTYSITTARIVAARATPEQLAALARERAPDPAVFDAATPFFWPAEISSTRLDSYFGHMAEDTLKNFAADAQAGVAFLEAHRWWTVPFGASLAGVFEAGQGETPARTVADFFTLPGLIIEGQRTSDDFIRRVSAGIQRDVSVGFHIGPRADSSRGRYVCDVCGGNLMDWRACPHIPGLTYEITDQVGRTEQQLATFTVFNGSLSEVSAVYDGATPGATILKARQAAEDGQLDERQVMLLETRYRMSLPTRRLVGPGVAISPGTSPGPRPPAASGSRATETEEPTMDLAAQLRSLFGLAETTPDEEIVTLTRDLRATRDEVRDLLAARPETVAGQSLPEAVRAMAGTIDRLTPLAEEGRAYRDELTAAALAEAVRAFGAAAEAQNAPVLAPLSLEQIRQMRDSWRTIADARLPGGRITIDSAEGRETPTGEPGALPARIYQH